MGANGAIQATHEQACTPPVDQPPVHVDPVCQGVPHPTPTPVVPIKSADADALDGIDSTGFAAAGHNHDATYLGIGATAVNSDLLDGLDSAAFAGAGHNHDARYYTKTESDARFPSADTFYNKTAADTRFLGISAKAADSDKLDGLDSAAFAGAAHNHDANYLGISAKAADSDKLDGLDSVAFALAGHGHALEWLSHSAGRLDPFDPGQIGIGNVVTINSLSLTGPGTYLIEASVFGQLSRDVSGRIKLVVDGSVLRQSWPILGAGNTLVPGMTKIVTLGAGTHAVEVKGVCDGGASGCATIEWSDLNVVRIG